MHILYQFHRKESSSQSMGALCINFLNWLNMNKFTHSSPKYSVNIFNGYSNPSTVPVGDKNRRMVKGGGWGGGGGCELVILWSSIVRELRNKKDLKKTEIWSAKGAKSRFWNGN